MDTLTSMQVFRLAVELKSFAAAARQLDMSPAMASKHVMHLERRLGALLLNRTSRRLSLTEAGTVYFDHARQMLDDLEDVEASVAQSTAAPRGTLRLSAPVWMANPDFIGVLNDYRARYPEVRLDVDLSGRFVNLVEERIDLALRVTNPMALGQSLIARPIAPVAFYIVGAPAYLNRAGRPTRAADLGTHAMLSYSLMPDVNRLDIEGPDGRETVKVDPVLQSNDESLMRLAALEGMGLALLPNALVSRDIQSGRLEAVLPGYRVFDSQLYGVYQNRKYLSPKVRTFLDFISGDARVR
ncbi:LysR family transcriptional regulator [Paraburkholderia sp. NMBU_R16]|uniref:LysR family transcriptional regulator n=1 Tax=Paraburkholderia sp. NMBU_R16 TaxID=2698676 RepID=UPI001563E83F|nr:LysR family transcriptional regulator [Paraburkholderia sp. NMBU_R16]NRO96499.1 LysR family transcriptional regulator [Paraburkholderia sp. NMBU_R16]